MKIRTTTAVLMALFSLSFASCDAGKRRPEVDDPDRVDSAIDEASPAATTNAHDDPAPIVASTAVAWGRFRGPNGTGISTDPNIPLQWSDEKNLKWKTALPGAGSSSPVLTEDYVFVTSYSGYGAGAKTGASKKNLQRHFSCVDRHSGTILWSKSIDNKVNEDSFSGNGLPQHGYATNTPVTDGKSVFVFLGKTGVIAYDFQGNERWRKSVGTSSASKRWGSAASLILIDDKLIVNAAEESETIFALNKETGETLWKSEAGALELSYSTPALVEVDDRRSDLVVAVPEEVWGLNPETGKLRWLVKTTLTGNVSPSVIVDGTTVYVYGGYRSKGSLAIKVGGKGDVTDTNVLWTSQTTSYVPTPVLHEKRLHWIDDKGIYFCQDATNGKNIIKSRMSIRSGGGRAVYASPLSINGKLYAQTRYDGLVVLVPGDKMEPLHQNKFDDDSQFNATPAVDAGQLFLRSDTFLYCVQ